jgi:hypothetical protein
MFRTNKTDLATMPKKQLPRFRMPYGAKNVVVFSTVTNKWTVTMTMTDASVLEGTVYGGHAVIKTINKTWV